MEESWEDVIVELERTTAAVATLDLSAADFRRILEIMNRRSEVVARLREMTAATASPALIERLKAIVDEGERLEQKLLLLRAAARAELTRLCESAHLLRYAQGTARVRQRINCTG